MQQKWRGGKTNKEQNCARGIHSAMAIVTCF
jgi:hypothetical protein